MRYIALVLAVFALGIVACEPVEQPFEAPQPSEVVPEMPQEPEESGETDEHDTEGSEQATDSSEISDDVDHVFSFEGESFVFYLDGEQNPDVVVQQGDRVRVEFTSTSGVHDWVVDAFGSTEVVQAGGDTFVEFVADQAGTFEYYCSVGSHRQQGMRGNFIVE